MEPDSPLKDSQFRLIGLLGLMTVAGIYFAIERASGGHFSLPLLGGAALGTFVGIPLLWACIWLAKSFYEGSLSSIGMLIVLVAGIVLMGLVTMTRL